MSGTEGIPAIGSDEPEGMRKQTIEAVKKGEAWPTAEGMEDLEIAEAFRKKLESMSEDELSMFAEDLEQTSQEIVTLYNQKANHADIYRKLWKGFKYFTGASVVAGAVDSGLSMVTGGQGANLGAAMFLVLGSMFAQYKENYHETAKEGAPIALGRAQASINSIQEVLTKMERGD